MNKQQGLTLIELVIVMVIVGILAAIAVPSYTSHMKKTRRNMAAGCLQENAQFLERWYTTKMTYEEAEVQPCATEIQPFYTVSVDITGPREFTLSAVPKGAQEKDQCGTITLDDKGLRKSSGSGTGCW